jgi:hypothetical protein
MLPVEMSGQVWSVRACETLAKEHLGLRFCLHICRMLGRFTCGSGPRGHEEGILTASAHSQIRTPNILRLACRSLNLAVVAMLCIHELFNPQSHCEGYTRRGETDCVNSVHDTMRFFGIDQACIWVSADQIGGGMCSSPRPSHFSVVICVCAVTIACTGFHRLTSLLCSRIHRLFYRLHSRTQAIDAMLLDHPQAVTDGSIDTSIFAHSCNTATSHTHKRDVVEFSCFQTLTNTMLRGACLDVMRANMDDVALSYESISVVNECMCISDQSANLDVVSTIHTDKDYFSKLKSQKVPARESRPDVAQANAPSELPPHGATKTTHPNVRSHLTFTFHNDSVVSGSREHSEFDQADHSFYSHSLNPNHNAGAIQSEDGKLGDFNPDADDHAVDEQIPDEENNHILGLHSLVKLSKLDEILLQDVHPSSYAHKLITRNRQRGGALADAHGGGGSSAYRYHAVLTSRKIKQARREAAEIATHLYFSPHISDTEKNIFLLQKFLVGACFGGRNYQRSRDMCEHFFFKSYESLSSSSRLSGVVEYSCLLMILGYFMLCTYYLLFVGTALDAHSSKWWLQTFFICICLDAVIMLPLQIVLDHVCVPFWSIFGSNRYLCSRLRCVHGLLRERANSVMKRRVHMSAVAHSLVQHFNPAMRAARLCPHLPASRLLMSLTDDDLPESLIRKYMQPPERQSKPVKRLFQNLLLVPGKEGAGTEARKVLNKNGYKEYNHRQLIIPNSLKLYLCDLFIAASVSFVCVGVSLLLYQVSVVGGVILAMCVVMGICYLFIFHPYSVAHNASRVNRPVERPSFDQRSTTAHGDVMLTQQIPPAESGSPKHSKETTSSDGANGLEYVNVGALELLNRGNYRNYWFKNRPRTHTYTQDFSAPQPRRQTHLMPPAQVHPVVHPPVSSYVSMFLENISGKSSKSSTKSSNNANSGKALHKVVPFMEINDDKAFRQDSHSSAAAYSFGDVRGGTSGDLEVTNVDEYTATQTDLTMIRSANTSGQTARSTPNTSANNHLSANNTSSNSEVRLVPPCSSQKGDAVKSVVPPYLIKQNVPFANLRSNKPGETDATTAATSCQQMNFMSRPVVYRGVLPVTVDASTLISRPIVRKNSSFVDERVRHLGVQLSTTHTTTTNTNDNSSAASSPRAQIVVNMDNKVGHDNAAAVLRSSSPRLDSNRGVPADVQTRIGTALASAPLAGQASTPAPSSSLSLFDSLQEGFDIENCLKST